MLGSIGRGQHVCCVRPLVHGSMLSGRQWIRGSSYLAETQTACALRIVSPAQPVKLIGDVAPDTVLDTHRPKLLCRAKPVQGWP